jgi:hypothetical protein
MELLEDKAYLFRPHAVEFGRRNAGDVFAIEQDVS